MAYPISRIGDTSDHGGAIVTGSPDWDVDGAKVARIGDIFACPLHGRNPIVSSLAMTTQDHGQPVAHIGSVTACGATISTGATTCMVE